MKFYVYMFLLGVQINLFSMQNQSNQKPLKITQWDPSVLSKKNNPEWRKNYTHFKLGSDTSKRSTQNMKKRNIELIQQAQKNNIVAIADQAGIWYYDQYSPNSPMPENNPLINSKKQMVWVEDTTGIEIVGNNEIAGSLPSKKSKKQSSPLTNNDSQSSNVHDMGMDEIALFKNLDASFNQFVADQATAENAVWLAKFLQYIGNGSISSNIDPASTE